MPGTHGSGGAPPPALPFVPLPPGASPRRVPRSQRGVSRRSGGGSSAGATANAYAPRAAVPGADAASAGGGSRVGRWCKTALLTALSSRVVTIVLLSAVACGALLLARPAFLYSKPDDPLDQPTFSWPRAVCWCALIVAVISLASLKGGALVRLLPFAR